MTFPSRGGPDEDAPNYDLAGAQVDPGLATEFVGLGLARIDSKGRPFIFDDFGGGLAGWNVVLAGANAQVQAYGLRGYAAAQCCRLDPGSSGAGSAQISKPFNTLPANFLGLETSFYPINQPTFTIQVQGFVAGAPTYGQLGYDAVSNFWKVDTPIGLQVVAINTISLNAWITIKLIINLLTGKYTAAILNSASTTVRMPLSAHTLKTGFIIAGGSAGIQLTATANAAGHTVDVGYVLLTTDEP